MALCGHFYVLESSVVQGKESAEGCDGTRAAAEFLHTSLHHGMMTCEVVAVFVGKTKGEES